MFTEGYHTLVVSADEYARAVKHAIVGVDSHWFAWNDQDDQMSLNHSAPLRIIGISATAMKNMTQSFLQAGTHFKRLCRTISRVLSNQK